VRYGAPGFPSKAVAKASKGETNFFYCGRATAGSEARQRIRISQRNGLIDSAGLSLKLTVRIGSHSNDGDSGRMVVRYLNGAGGVLGELATQSVAATAGQLPRFKASGAVPAGTRALLVVLEGTAAAGPDCDVFFDNVSVKLVRARP